jgi:nucleoside-diphosphate-sugar epimerase
MLSDAKVLVTGPAGQIAFPLVQALAAGNEVWGVARFGDPAARRRVEALGITTRSCDIAAGDFGDLPDDFTHVVHLAAFQGPTLDYDHALAVNAEGTGMLLHHCRKAKAALVMSTQSVYKPNDDAGHVYVETDPLGDTNPVHSPTYSIAKIAQEAVARYCARAYDLPVVLARMNASYGPNGGLVSYHADAVIAGQPVSARWDPQPYRPIHQDDINAQLGALLDAASVPATIVNWAGDEVVTVQEWCAYAGELTGRPAPVVVKEMPGTQRGSIADVTRRVAITGPCSVPWREGMRQTIAARHPEAVAG